MVCTIRGIWLARHARLQIRVLAVAELLLVLQLSGQRIAVDAGAEVRGDRGLLVQCRALGRAERHSSATGNRPASGHGGVDVIQPEGAGAGRRCRLDQPTDPLPAWAPSLSGGGEKEKNTNFGLHRLENEGHGFTWSDTRRYGTPPKESAPDTFFIVSVCPERLAHPH